MPSYPAGLSVSNHALLTLTDALRHHRSSVGTRWRRLSVGDQAIMVLAHLRKGETYAELAAGYGIGTTTVFRYIHEAIDALAALAPTLAAAMTIAARKAFVNIDGTLLRIDRVGMGSGRDRPYFSGKQVPRGERAGHRRSCRRLVWASPALPGARHDMGAAAENGILQALRDAEVKVIADNGYRGSGFEVPQRRRPQIPRPGNAAGCRPTRRRSTPPTPVSAARVNGRTRS